MSDADIFRDALNPALAVRETSFVETQRFVPGDVIDVNSQWCRVIPSEQGGQGNGFIPLVSDDGTLQFIGCEPFFVAGKQRLRVPGNFPFSSMYFQRATRRELLSGAPYPSYPSNGSGLTELYNQTFITPSVAAGQWAYLDANLTWRVAAVGVVASLPFGWGVANAANRGRYFDVQVSLNSGLGGIKGIYFAPVADPAGAQLLAAAFQVNPSSGNPSSYVTVGDEATILATSAAFVASGYANVKSARAWTIGLVPTAVATIDGYMSVIRRGF